MSWLTGATHGRLLEQLKRHEGLRLEAYRDTVGVWTIGYGHTSGVQEGDTCSRMQAESWLQDDAEIAVAGARALFGRHTDKLSQVRRAVLANMSFNMGTPRLNQFIALERAIWREDWRKASAEMVDSRWAGQVGRRAYELAYQMRAGRWW